MHRGAIIFMLLLLTACGTPEERAVPRAASSSPSASSSPGSSPSRAPASLYEANATVLDEGDSGPMLCLGVMLDSLPPQCGDVPVLGWKWDEVAGEERVNGVTWGGEYHVIGTFDGETFELTKKPRPAVARLNPTDEFSSDPACDEPPGGWTTEGEGIDQEAAGRVLQSIQNDPEYAAGWMTQLAPTTDGTDTGPVVVNAAFTGHVTDHEKRLRGEWPGSLCVVEYERTYSDLQRIQREAGELASEMGSQNLYSDVDVTRNLVNLHLVHLSEDTRAELERTFGRDALKLSAALVPVEE